MATIINFPSPPKYPHHEELPTPESLAKSLGCNLGLATYYHNKMKQYISLGAPCGNDVKDSYAGVIATSQSNNNII